MKQILKPYGRLSLCAEMVREGSRLADIGTDHGYLPIELCKSGKCPSALACDINPLPLRSAEENIAKFGLSKRIKTRLSDGLKEISPDEVDDIVIAGMGGELIRDILSAAPWVKSVEKHFVLQPMTHHEDLVSWLYGNGFAIDRQEAVFDENKYYTVIAASYTGEKRSLSLYEAIIGKLDPDNELSRGFLRRALNNLRNKSKGNPSLLPVIRKLEETKVKIHDIIEYTQTIAPYETAAEWDNVGLLTGAEDAQVSRVLLSLDITPAIIEEAREKGAELIISHHPVIFSPFTSLSPDDPVYLLAKYDIAALCLHTNLDRAQQGVNTALAEALGLKNTVFYPEDFLLIGDPDDTYDASSYATVIKERLNAPSVRYTNGKVSRVAVSSGGGGEGVELCTKHGFDAFISGELKHHHYLYARTNGIAAFDAGHYSTEIVIVEPLKNMLEERFPDLTFILSDEDICPYRSV